MEVEVINVESKQVAESIATGLRTYFQSDLSVRQVGAEWSVIATGIVPESVRLLMNHYGLGVLDCKSGKL